MPVRRTAACPTPARDRFFPAGFLTPRQERSPRAPAGRFVWSSRFSGDFCAASPRPVCVTEGYGCKARSLLRGLNGSPAKKLHPTLHSGTERPACAHGFLNGDVFAAPPQYTEPRRRIPDPATSGQGTKVSDRPVMASFGPECPPVSGVPGSPPGSWEIALQGQGPAR